MTAADHDHRHTFIPIQGRVVDEQAMCFVILTRKPDWQGQTRETRVAIPKPQLQQRAGKLWVPRWLAEEGRLPQEKP